MKENIVYAKPQMKYPEEKGLISVIVPIYNGEIYLRETLDSILAQTFANWEAILVNDGSTDSCLQICEEYATRDARFKIFTQENKGVLLARKTGLENSKGQYIATIDQDDIYHKNFLEKMFVAADENNADFAWCKFSGYPRGHRNNARDYKWRENPKENIEHLFNGTVCYHVLWNRIIRRSVYEKIEIPLANINYAEDPIQFLQIVFHSHSAVFVSLELYSHRVNSVTSVTRSFKVFNKGKRCEFLILGTFILYELSLKFGVKLKHIEKYSIPKSKSKYFLWLDSEKQAKYECYYKSFPKKIRGSFPLNLFITFAENGFILPLRIYKCLADQFANSPRNYIKFQSTVFRRFYD